MHNNVSLTNQVQKWCQLVHGGPRFASEQEMDDRDHREKSRSKETLLSSSENCDQGCWYLWLLLFSSKLEKMIKAIKDIANALIPSGKLAFLVETLLVLVSNYYQYFGFHFYNEYQMLITTRSIQYMCICVCVFLLNFAASDVGHTPVPFQWWNQRDCSCC